MANTLTIDQIAPVLRAVVKQATGRGDLANYDVTQLLTIGNTALMADTEKMLNSISQVLTRTIISARPYKAAFQRMQKSPEAWGNFVRKIKICDKDTDIQDNEAVNLRDGASVDMYKVDNTVVLQLNFYGQQAYTIKKTIYETQFNTCFNSAEEFSRFISAIFIYVTNKMEVTHEATGRATLCGLMGGIVADPASAANQRVVHLITEYSAEVGKAPKYTTAEIMAPEVFEPFMRWVYGRINTISDMMTEYTTLYQSNVTGKSIDQHTPKERQICYLYQPIINQMRSRVLNTLVDSFLTLPGYEGVNFWQSVKTPDAFMLEDVSYLGTDGAIKKKGSPVKQAGVFGILFDEEAAGYVPVLRNAKVTPDNAAADYRNYFWKFWERHYIDFSEKAVVFLLD